MASKSQPSGLRGWRRATTTPTAAVGTPITSAVATSEPPPARKDSGTMATANSTSATPATPAHVAADGTRKRTRLPGNSSLVLPDPDRDVRGLQGPAHHVEQVRADRTQVDCVLQARAERRHGHLSVVPGSVETPVHHPLHPAPHWIE